jgi:hypothetical protein
MGGKVDANTRVDFEKVRRHLRYGFPSGKAVNADVGAEGALLLAGNGEPIARVFPDEENVLRFEIYTKNVEEVRRFLLLCRSAGLNDEQIFSWTGTSPVKAKLDCWLLGRSDPRSLLKGFAEVTDAAWIVPFFEARVQDLTMEPGSSTSPEKLAAIHAKAIMETFTLAKKYPERSIEDWMKKVG